jgi:hypothetical protein
VWRALEHRQPQDGLWKGQADHNDIWIRAALGFQSHSCSDSLQSLAAGVTLRSEIFKTAGAAVANHLSTRSIYPLSPPQRKPFPWSAAHKARRAHGTPHPLQATASAKDCSFVLDGLNASNSVSSVTQPASATHHKRSSSQCRLRRPQQTLRVRVIRRLIPNSGL